MSGLALAMLGCCIVAEAARELCFKRAAGQLAGGASTRTWLRAARDPWMGCGILLWAGEMLLWILTLEYIPLGIAFPLMALSYAATPLAARVLLGERLTRPQAAGIALNVGGAACVGLAGL